MGGLHPHSRLSACFPFTVTLREIPLTLSRFKTRPAGVKESLGALDVSLTAEELKEIRNLVENAGVVGGRYFKAHEAMLAV